MGREERTSLTHVNTRTEVGYYRVRSPWQRNVKTGTGESAAAIDRPSHRIVHTGSEVVEVVSTVTSSCAKPGSC